MYFKYSSSNLDILMSSNGSMDSNLETKVFKVFMSSLAEARKSRNISGCNSIIFGFMFDSTSKEKELEKL